MKNTKNLKFALIIYYLGQNTTVFKYSIKNSYQMSVGPNFLLIFFILKVFESILKFHKWINRIFLVWLAYYSDDVEGVTYSLKLVRATVFIQVSIKASMLYCSQNSMANTNTLELTLYVWVYLRNTQKNLYNTQTFSLRLTFFELTF
jgi:hypothetical protein